MGRTPPPRTSGFVCSLSHLRKEISMGAPFTELSSRSLDPADRRGAWWNRWRSFRHLMRSLKGSACAETSPLLIHVAVVLAFLIVVLEIDAHRDELEFLGVLTNNYPVPAA